MTVTLGSLELPFACVEVDARDVAIKEIEYPGVDFSDAMDMGARGRRISITGRLPDALGGATTADDIESLDKSEIAELDTGIGGRTFPSCRVLNAKVGPLQKVIAGGVEVYTGEYTIELNSMRNRE